MQHLRRPSENASCWPHSCHRSQGPLVPPRAGVRQAGPAPQWGSVGAFLPRRFTAKNAADWSVFDPERAINTAELTIENRAKRHCKLGDHGRARRRTRFHNGSFSTTTRLKFRRKGFRARTGTGANSFQNRLGGNVVARRTTTDEDPLTASPPGRNDICLREPRGSS